MYRSELANHLLMQLVVETTDDVLLLSEQYCDRDCPTWYADGVDTAAVWVVNPQKIYGDNHGSTSWHVLIRDGNVTYVSCYPHTQ